MSLEMKDVSYLIKDKKLVSEVSLSVASGELVGLVGPNGAGKSTALKLISGELKPSFGNVSLEGTSLGSITSAELSLSRSVMAQSTNVVFDFSVAEIIKMGWVQGRLIDPELMSVAMKQIVNECDVSQLLNRTFNSLSGGEQQRVQFARNLVQLWRPDSTSYKPRYLLLDEPTASLDLAHELLLLNLLRSAKQQNIGVLIVMHDLNLAARFLDKVVLMTKSRVVDIGTPAMVLNADQLSEVYRTKILVERNNQLDRLVIHT
jgi:iron complex transport system ATP-binding protein